MQVYLDHNATTQCLPEVFEAMTPYFGDYYGNPSSIHTKGRQARKAIEEARQAVSDSLNTESVDIIFTSGGTESNNLAIKGVAYANKDRGRHIITSAVEHPSAINACKFLQNDEGFEITYIAVDRFGMVDIERVRNAFRKDTILVSIIHANNEVGTIQPISEISRIAKDKGAYFHTDAVQSFGKIPVNVDDLGVDLLSISAHKVYGPKGAGALFVRKGVKMTAIQHGGSQESSLRAGTENVCAIAGFAKAVLLLSNRADRVNNEIQGLSSSLYEGLKDKIDGFFLNGHPKSRLFQTINLCFDGVDGEALVADMDVNGISASTGSACSEGAKEPSYVLLAMGLTPQQARSSVRFSLGINNTKEEIDYCLSVIPKLVKKLRK